MEVFSPKKMECKELVCLLKTSKVILIDTRPYSEYVVGHIRLGLTVRLSSLLTRRLLRGKIGLLELVIEEQHDQYKALCANPSAPVIVYNECVDEKKMQTFDSKSALHVILKFLATQERPSFYLAGGMQAMRENFPDDIVVPEVIPRHCPFLSINKPDEPDLALPERTLPKSPPSRRGILDLSPSQILPFLYIGAKKDAIHRPTLDSLKVNHVLNVTTDCPNAFEKESTFKYLQIPIMDTWNQDLPKHFQRAFDFIDEAKKVGGCVLIHCIAGVSRSPAITIAYVMKEKNLSLADAYSFVKNKRSVISPNLDFMGELQHFERKIQASSASKCGESEHATHFKTWSIEGAGDSGIGGEVPQSPSCSSTGEFVFAS